MPSDDLLGWKIATLVLKVNAIETMVGGIVGQNNLPLGSYQSALSKFNL